MRTLISVEYSIFRRQKGSEITLYERTVLAKFFLTVITIVIIFKVVVASNPLLLCATLSSFMLCGGCLSSSPLGVQSLFLRLSGVSTALRRADEEDWELIPRFAGSRIAWNGMQLFQDRRMHQQRKRKCGLLVKPFMARPFNRSLMEDISEIGCTF